MTHRCKLVDILSSLECTDNHQMKNDFILGDLTNFMFDCRGINFQTLTDQGVHVNSGEE